jgi:hypothetical protein
LTSVQKYFKPLIFESKIMFKIQKKEKEFMLQPPWLSAHFRLSFTPTETGPLRSAFQPGMTHQGVVSHLWLPSAPPPLQPHRRAVRR